MSDSDLSVSTDELPSISFTEHRDSTAADIDAVIEQLQALATQVRDGDVSAFSRWWIEGGTEDGDATISRVRELLVIRFMYREQMVAI